MQKKSPVKIHVSQFNWSVLPLIIFTSCVQSLWNKLSIPSLCLIISNIVTTVDNRCFTVSPIFANWNRNEIHQQLAHCNYSMEHVWLMSISVKLKLLLIIFTIDDFIFQTLTDRSETEIITNIIINHNVNHLSWRTSISTNHVRQCRFMYEVTMNSSAAY